MMCGLDCTLSSGGRPRIGKHPTDPANGVHRNSDDQAMRLSRDPKGVGKKVENGARKGGNSHGKRERMRIRNTHVCEAQNQRTRRRTWTNFRACRHEVRIGSVWCTTIRKLTYFSIIDPHPQKLDKELARASNPRQPNRRNGDTASQNLTESACKCMHSRPRLFVTRTLQKNHSGDAFDHFSGKGGF